MRKVFVDNNQSVSKKYIYNISIRVISIIHGDQSINDDGERGERKIEQDIASWNGNYYRIFFTLVIYYNVLL